MSPDWVMSPERVVRIDIPNHAAVYTLERQVDLAIIDARDKFVTAYADDHKIGRLRNLGYNVTVLVEDYRKQLPLIPAVYATYAQVCSTMYYLASAYPAITRIETLGTSVQGRAILIMKVTADPGQEANKPRIRLNGVHHGNEKTATEITLAFLKYLCENYATNPGVQALVDTREIWIDPIFNVDGHVNNVRYNANGVDLNRDYGYEWNAEGSSTSPYSQPETQAMRNHCEQHVITLEYSYHTNASYVNYLWDNHPVQTPDSGWIQPLSARYADSTYGTYSQLDSINGYSWYEVHGSCQDNTYGNYGGFGWTIETPQPSDRPTVDSICLANRRALLDMIRLAGWGIQGLVHDSLTGSPLFARVEFTNPYLWNTYTQPQVGDFHKMVPPGTYTVRVTANGYVPKTISSVVVPETGAVSLDFPLAAPETGTPDYVQKTVWVQRLDPSYVYRDWVIRALGPPDGVFYSLGPSGSAVVFDVDPYQPVRNSPGNDITVYATGPYTLSAANDWEGPWLSLGSGNGTAGFDIGSVGLDSARYLKVASNGTATLDAISYLSQPEVGRAAPGIEQLLTDVEVGPNPARSAVTVSFSSVLGTKVDIRVCDVTGRVIRTLGHQVPVLGREHFTWNLCNDANLPVAGGVYFYRIEGSSGAIQRKLVVER